MANLDNPLSLSDSTQYDLLNLGLLTMSLSSTPFAPMNSLINKTLSEPINNTLIELVGGRMGSPGGYENPFSALTALKQLIDVLEAPNQGMPLACLASRIWLGVAGAFVFLRLVVKRFITTGVTRDDWAIFVSWCFALLMLLITRFGFQQYKSCIHVWGVSWWDYRGDVKSLYYSQLMYIITTWSIKAAVMLWYWDLVPRSPTFLVFHRIIIAAFVGMTTISLAVLLTTIFQCQPIQWWRDPLTAKCVPRLQLWLAADGLMFLSSVVVLLLPIRVVWMLNLQRREKYVVIGLFLLGALRGMGIHGVLPPIIAACIPATKALVVKFAPAIIGYGISRMPTLSKTKRRSQESGESEGKSPSDTESNESLAETSRMRNANDSREPVKSPVPICTLSHEWEKSEKDGTIL